MAVACFLELEGVKGESVDKVHKGKIDILSWNWGLSTPALPSRQRRWRRQRRASTTSRSPSTSMPPREHHPVLARTASTRQGQDHRAQGGETRWNTCHRHREGDGRELSHGRQRRRRALTENVTLTFRR